MIQTLFCTLRITFALSPVNISLATSGKEELSELCMLQIHVVLVCVNRGNLISFMRSSFPVVVYVCLSVQLQMIDLKMAYEMIHYVLSGTLHPAYALIHFHLYYSFK